MARGDMLAGRVALITGGARGQGAAEGRLFTAEGATVVLADVIDADGEQTAKEIDGTYVHLDVASEEEWETVVADVMATHGHLDVVVNNAGIFRAGRLVEETIEQWDQVIAINQTGVFLGMRAAAKAMIEAGRGGSIINISSVAGLEGIFGSMAYSASKWAVRGMTKVAAKELGRYGIRVNSIHPGLIETPMTAGFPAVVDDEKRRRAQKQTPLGRFGTPEDIANMALFLAGDGSDYCTGQEFVVDGGVHG
ncbi:MAG: 3alpha(or 20beta)-hydroxysteroid dehydrogenase [Acidimicrobiaceae bacterium]|nr:3alpha(or 20beta)-hydroxysteroid dehydrogenase [Acidimicrobiaceae bacterium]